MAEDTETISPQTMRPDSAVDPKWATAWQGMNPAGTPQQMNEDYFFAKAGKVKPVDLGQDQTTPPANPTKPGDMSPGGLWASAKDVGAFARDNATALLRKPLDWAGDADVAMGIKTPEQAQSRADTYSKMLVPQTPAGIVPWLLPAVKAGLLAKTGLGVAAGTGLNAASGENPIAGGVEGGAGAVLPAAVGGVANFLGKAGQKITTNAAMRETVDVPWAQRMMQSMKEDVPALWKRIAGVSGSPPAKLGAIQDPAIFDQAMRPQMDRVENAIAAAVPKIASPFPTAVSGGATNPIEQLIQRADPARMAKLNPGMVASPAIKAGPEMVDTVDAFKQWHDTASKAASSYDPRYPGANYQLRQDAKAWEDAIDSAAPAHLADVWKAARAEFGRAVRYRELGKQALVEADPNAVGTAFNPQGVVAHYYSDPQRYAPSKLPGFHKNFWGGGEMGVQPTITDPGLYARIFGPGGIKANIPTPKGVTLPGTTYGAPKTADALSTAARAGVVSLGNQTANP